MEFMTAMEEILKTRKVSMFSMEAVDSTLLKSYVMQYQIMLMPYIFNHPEYMSTGICT